jgi:hypothetical protein
MSLSKAQRMFLIVCLVISTAMITTSWGILILKALRLVGTVFLPSIVGNWPDPM